ncbi:MAG: hypothetical protein AAGI01_14645 [Myxococcota bacterium]
MDREEFGVLLQYCGFALSKRDLEEMKRADLLIELSDEVARPYCALHLFVVAKYMELVTRPHHPWRAEVESKLDQVAELARRIARVAEEVRGPGPNGPSPQELEQLGADIRRYADLLDPFGPLAEVIDFVREDVVEQLRGHGRLYAELRASARGLEALSERLEADEQAPAKLPNDVLEPSVDADDTQEIDAEGLRTTQVMEKVEETSSGEEETFEESGAVPGVAPPPMPSSPRVGSVDGANPFMRQSPIRTTGETLALKSRLKALAPVTEATDEASVGEGAQVDEEPEVRPTIAGRIEELNTKRQELLEAKDWAGLVELYEGSIELFEGAEHLQVLMMMARLQDRKLGERERAYLNLLRAVPYASGASLGVLFDEMHGLVEREGMLGDHEGWLQELAAGDELSGEDRPYAQRALARAMRAGGNGERAFLSYASYVVDHPEQALSVEALDFLDGLAAEATPEELGGVYEELLEHERMDAGLEALVAARAGMRAVDSADMEKGARYLRRALDLDPSETAVFHALAAAYEELGQWIELAELYEEYAKAHPEDAEVYVRAMERAKAHAQQDVEGTLEHYKAKVGADPSDAEALARVERAYIGSERYAEGYAFLTQHLERVGEPERRVEILLSLARIAKDYLREPGEAVIHYARVIDLVPDHMEALKAMHELGG